MSLCRLRRVVPLAQQTLSAAPGALHQFSSSADSASLGGVAAGDASSSSTPPVSGRGASRPGSEATRGSRRPAADEQGSSGRRAGAMSQLLQTNKQQAVAAAAAARQDPTEMSPYEVIMDFEYALKTSSSSKSFNDGVPLRSLASDIADIANTDNLPFLRYYMSDRQWAEFCSGDMDEEEQNDLMDKLAAALLADDRFLEKKAAVRAAIDADPDYDIAASLGSRPQLRGSPRGPKPTVEGVAAEIEANRGQLMAQYGLSAEEFEAAKEATVRQEVAARMAARQRPLPNHLAHEQRLTRLLERRLPRDHPHYQAVQQRLAVVQANPGWSHERKMVFAKRLIKRMAAA